MALKSKEVDRMVRIGLGRVKKRYEKTATVLIEVPQTKVGRYFPATIVIDGEESIALFDEGQWRKLLNAAGLDGAAREMK